MTQEYQTAKIRKMVQAAFSDHELQDFCFDHFHHVYEQFSNGMGRSVKIHLLLDYCKRQGKYDELLEKVKEHNPYQFQKFNYLYDGETKSEEQQKGTSYNKKSLVEIVTACDIDLSNLTSAQREGLIVGIKVALATSLNIPASEVKVMGIRPGSIVMDVYLPTDVIEQLLAFEDDFLEKELGIQKVFLKKLKEEAVQETRPVITPGTKAARSYTLAWKATLAELESQMTKATFNTWLKGTQLISYEDGEYVINVRNDYAKDWLETRLHDAIVSTLTSVAGEKAKIRFVVMSNEVASLAPSVTPVTQQSTSLIDRLTFSTFVVGPSNRLAHAAAISAAENPGRTYNPLFIYGRVGLGKTHLLHAIGHQCEQDGRTIRYLSSEAFTNDLMQSIHNKELEQFRKQYTELDVLMIDDIQFIAGKESTQEELFRILNLLDNKDKQIVITSDRPSQVMVTFKKPLRSFFERGLIADIQLPDLATRKVILQSKMEGRDITIPDNILEVIALSARNNIRELEGALNKVIAYAQLANQDVDEDLVNLALSDLIQQTNKVTVDQIIDAVCTYFNVTPKALFSDSRRRSIAFPRQMAMYLARTETFETLPQIGAKLGNRDHSTVLDAYKKIAALIESDPKMRQELAKIKAQITAFN